MAPRAKAWDYCRAWTPPPSRVRFPPHRHDGVELILVLQGHARIHGPADEMMVASGDLVWIPPGCLHTLLDATRDFRLHVGSLPAPELPTPQCWHTRLSADTVRQCDVLFGLVRDLPDLHGRCQAASLLLRLAHAALKAPLTQELPFRLHRALDYLRQHPRATRLQLARIATMAPGTLSRLMTAHTGQTLVDLRRHARIDRFLHLARNHQGTLLEHAFAAGYGSYSQCHRDCLHVTGHPPRVALGLDHDTMEKPSAST